MMNMIQYLGVYGVYILSEYQVLTSDSGEKNVERVQIMRQKLKQVTIWFLALIAASSSRALDV